MNWWHLLQLRVDLLLSLVVLDWRLRLHWVLYHWLLLRLCLPDFFNLCPQVLQVVDSLAERFLLLGWEKECRLWI